MAFWSSNKKEEQRDKAHDETLEMLFKELDKETDENKRKAILAEIRTIQENYKKEKKKKGFWKYFIDE